MSDRTGFIIYTQQIDALLKMPGDSCKEALEAMRNYALNGKEYSGDNLVVSVFMDLVRAQINANNKKYENGKKGGRPVKIPAPDYIIAQENGKLPAEKKASKELIDKVKKEQEKLT